MRPRTVLTVFALVAVVSCGSSAPPATVDGIGAGAGGGCASLVLFHGHEYLGRHAAVIPETGRVIGHAVLPPCSDTGQGSATGERVAVTTVAGVDPNVAVVQEGSPDLVYVREDVDRLPPTLVHAFTPLTCDPHLAPIRLQGTWIGILGADGNTELDMVPPYDVEVLVTRSSPPGYERADLTVRVPPSLGQPLSHTDVESSLRTGGEIDLIATCRGERFLARGVFVPAENSAQS